MGSSGNASIRDGLMLRFILGYLAASSKKALLANVSAAAATLMVICAVDA
jgi:hypothetical protein